MKKFTYEQAQLLLTETIKRHLFQGEQQCPTCAYNIERKRRVHLIACVMKDPIVRLMRSEVYSESPLSITEGRIEVEKVVKVYNLFEEKPYYNHSCHACQSLGQYSIRDKEDGQIVAYDLYYCPLDAFGQTVIARYDEGEEHYLSGMHLAIKYLMCEQHDHPLAVAYLRAQEKGLLK